jgi:hypothetical protein
VFEALKRREDANGLIQLDHKPQFSRGDKVCVRDGAFQQCLGLYEGMTSNERVTMLLELLERKVRVSLDAELLIAGLAGPKIGNTPALVWASWMVPRVAKSLGERSFSSSADRGHPIPT